MAGAATIGSLRVELGLNSAQFNAGLKKAQAGLSNFGKQASAGLAVVSAAAAAATVAISYAVKGAIDHADAMDDAAQKTGVAAEALSRLAYAANIDGISLDGLSAALVKLSQTMAEAAGNTKGPAAQAFKALGISVVDAQGKLRASDAVFNDLSNRFSRLEDGSTKSVLAVRLLGKSGAELIPLLNHGTAYLGNMADEADRLGQTISGKTAAAAGDFNDSLTRLQAVFTGIANQIAAEVLPALQSVVNALSDPAVIAGITSFASAAVQALAWIGQVAASAFKAFSQFRDAIRGGVYGLDYVSDQGLSDRLAANQKQITTLKSQIDQVKALSGTHTGSDGYTEPNSYMVAAPESVTGTAGAPGSSAELARLQEENDRTSAILAARKPPPVASGGGNSILPDTSPLKLPSGMFADHTAADKASDSYKKLVESAQQRIDQSKLESRVLGMTHVEAEKLRISQDLLNRAVNEGLKLTPKQTAQLQGLAGQIAETEDQTAQLTETFEVGKDAFKGLFSDIKSGLDEGKSGFEVLADAAKNALDKILDKMMDVATDQLWDQLVSGFGGGGSSSATGSGGELGNIISSIISSFGKRAAGGPVAIGRPYIIGERGPELFVPGASGTVVPNDALRGGGAGAMQVNVHNYAGASIKTQQSGNRMDLVVDQIVSQKLATRGSKSYRALQRVHGTRTALTGF